MELETLQARTRELSGKGPAHRSREAGEVPAILYGGGKDPVSVSITSRDFGHFLHRHSGAQAILQLEFTDASDMNTAVLVKQVQRHPLRESILHADFMRIRLDELIRTRVSIELVGQAVGIVEGGVLDQQCHELEIECIALEVPEKIEVDVSHLDIGEGMHVGEIEMPEGITLLTDTDRALAAVHVPRVVEEVVEEEEGLEGEEGEEGAEGEEGGEGGEGGDAKESGEAKEGRGKD